MAEPLLVHRKVHLKIKTSNNKIVQVQCLLETRFSGWSLLQEQPSRTCQDDTSSHVIYNTLLSCVRTSGKPGYSPYIRWSSVFPVIYNTLWKPIHNTELTLVLAPEQSEPCPEPYRRPYLSPRIPINICLTILYPKIKATLTRFIDLTLSVYVLHC